MVSLRRMIPSEGLHRLGGKGSYTGRVRRAGRATQRSGRALTSPSLYPRATVVPTFWWEEVKNFGDLLTPYFLPQWNIVPVLTPARDAALVGVGSLVQHLPEDFGGTLWGSGLIHDRTVELPDATTLALRGELTRARMGDPAVMALGDPGLLIERRVRRQQVRWDVGVVPHYVHREDERLRELVEQFDGTVTIVDVQQHPAAVAREIARCRVVLTTSLHGLIFADSFGIPAAWLVMPRELYGGDFKFHDHESVVRPARARRLRLEEVESLRQVQSLAVTADPARVARSCDDLVAAARRIPEVTRHERLAPLQVPARVFASALGSK